MTGENDTSTENRARARHQQDRDDLNNEMAGRETGRIKRFVTPDHLINGSAASSKDRDDFAFTAFTQIMDAQQREQYERLHQEFALYDKATKLALEDIDRDIERAEQELQQVRDNATVLSDGRRVYRDEATGQFYDEQDNALSEEDELEAQGHHRDGHSSRQQLKSSQDRIAALRTERREVIEYGNKQDKLRDRLKSHPEEMEDIQKELDDMPAPDRVKAHYDRLSADPAQDVRQQVSTSAAKEMTDGGIDTELSLMPAFASACSTEQKDSAPAPNRDLEEVRRQGAPGMAPV